MRLKLFLSLFLAGALCLYGCTKSEIEEQVTPNTPAEVTDPDETDENIGDVTDESGDDDDDFLSGLGDGTRESPYTVSQALDLINSGENKSHKGCYVKGYVAKYDIIANWGQIFYYITDHSLGDDDYEKEDCLYVPNGYGLGGEEVAGNGGSSDYMSEGDKIIVYGRLDVLTTYYDWPGITKSQIYYLNGVTADVEEDGYDDYYGFDPTEGVYYNDFDKVTLGFTYQPLMDSDCWKNEIGSGANYVDYNYSGDTYVQYANFASGDSSFSKYDGSDGNFIRFMYGTGIYPLKNYFVIKNISLPSGLSDYRLYFGAKIDSSASGSFSHDDFNVFISDDGNRWIELSYEFPNGDPDIGTWDLASTTFSLPSQTSELYIYFTSNLTIGYRLDDVCLMPSDTQGVSINFSTGIELPGYTGYEGDGTIESPYKVSQAVELVNSGSYDSDRIYFVKGLVAPSRSSGGGRISYYISESGYFQNEHELYISMGLYLGGENFAGSGSLQDLDEVIVYGNLSTMDEGVGISDGRLYYLNGTTADFKTEGNGTKDNPFTTADALKVIKSGLLGTDIYPDNVYYVKGVVSEIVNYRDGFEDGKYYIYDTEYNISDDGSGDKELSIKYGYNFCGVHWHTNNYLREGDEVIVYGNLSTSGMRTGTLYYLNGEWEDEDNVCYYMTDSHFKNFCYDNYDTDANGKVSFAEAEEVTTMSCSGTYSDGSGWDIDFAGIEYFPNLESFKSRSAKYLDVSRNTELSYICLNGYEGQGSNIITLNLSNNTKILSLDYASFYECKYLKSITFPESLQSIGVEAFLDCTSLESISLPENLSSMGWGAFAGCTSLKSVSFPKNLTVISMNTFINCTSLTTVLFPEKLETIGDNAFMGCTGLASVSFSEGLQSIGEYAFNGCTSLESLLFPETLSSIGSCAFVGCTSLTSVSFPKDLTEIKSFTFSNCTSLASVSLPENLEIIGYYAFNECTGMKSITFPEELETIRGGAFYGCTSLESLSFPEALKTIEASAFYGCESLESVSFPGNLQSISDSAFYDCTNLKTASISAKTPPSLGSDCFANIDSSAVLYVPFDYRGSYINSSWSKYFQITAQ